MKTITPQEFIAIRGFYGNTALVESKVQRKLSKYSIQQMLDEGYYKEAVFKAFIHNSDEDKDKIVQFFQKHHHASSFSSLVRAFGLQEDILEKIKKIKKV